MKQNAMLMALSDKLANENLVILDKLEMAEFKTKIFGGIISNLDSEKIIKQENKKRSILMIVGKADEKIKFSARNLPGVELLNLDNINLIGLLKYKNLILTKNAVEKLEERYK